MTEHKSILPLQLQSANLMPQIARTQSNYEEETYHGYEKHNSLNQNANIQRKHIRENFFCLFSLATNLKSKQSLLTEISEQ